MINDEEMLDKLIKQKQHDLINQVEEQLTRMEHERKKLEKHILKFQAACLDAGFKIAKIQYKLKNDKDEYGDERWYKWDSTSVKR